MKKSTAKWNKCIRKSLKWCRKHHRPNQSPEKCATRVCAFVKHKYS
jgi:hypothetical protein